MKLEDVKKPKINNWYQSPPEWIQNLGDGFQGTALFILGYVSLSETGEARWFAIVAIIIGAVGIFMQKVFKK